MSEEPKRVADFLERIKEPPKFRNCKICRFPGRDLVEEPYLRGELTLAEAVEKLEELLGIPITPTTFQAHMRYHVMKDAAELLVSSGGAEALVEIVFDKVALLQDLLHKIVERLEKMLVIPPDDPHHEHAIREYLSEVREYVVTIAKLEGEFKDFNIINVKADKAFIDLKSIILAELCPVCREKVMKRLEESN
jgi:hypothetical protein